jgi:2-hydroxy-3-oxopropionate reductase
MIEKIGFIGLGIMGKPMAANLVKAGYELYAYDVNQGAVQRMIKEGAWETKSPKELAKRADTIITMLPSDSIVEEVIFGSDGVLESLHAGITLVDMSTISPTTAMEIAEKLEANDMEMIDAPVSGGESGAIAGTLSIMAGGKIEIFERVLPALKVMGNNINYIGGHGAGQVAKIANQIITGLTVEAVAEALIFAKKAGADPQRVRKALLGGFAHSPILEEHGRRMLERNFEPGGKLSLHKKDTEIAMAMARELNIFLPGTSLVSQMWNAIAAQGGLDWDWSSIVKTLEMMSNAEISSP